MTESIMPLREYAWEKMLATPLKNAARKVFFSLLANLRYGRLTFRDGEVCRSFGGTDPRFPIEATVFVHDPKFYGRVLVGGTVGAGEAYMAGYWSADDLTAVIRIIVLNESIMAEMEKGWARLSAPFQRAFHRMRKDTREGSRANIEAHYDLGNDFYRLFLDETMTYSCGIFEGPDSTLAEASIAKYDRICRKLGLTDADHVLEIGAGWGGFAVHAAARYGCRVTATTISREQ
uniref:class I SAM-dependent methyltransferase n=1 Tax=Desulfococcus sp. TaxID=2025834 RepID=UPI003593480D